MTLEQYQEKIRNARYAEGFRSFSSASVEAEVDDPMKATKPVKKVEEDPKKAFNRWLKNGTGYPATVPANWVNCIILKVKVPPDEVVKVNSGGNSYTAHKINLDRGQMWMDFKGLLHYTGTERSYKHTIYDEEGKEQFYNSNYSYGESIYRTVVARGQEMYTTFPTNYRDHSSGDQKSFKRPEGEAFGIEIEVKFKDTPESKGWLKKLLFSKWVADNYQKNWICERDGSLEGEDRRDWRGLELISLPLPLDKMIADLEVILPKCSEMGGMGFKSSTDSIPCGIHVTQNLYGSNQRRDASRYIWLLNNYDFREFWQRVAQRRGGRFDHFCGFRDVPQETDALDWQINWCRAGTSSPYGHYCAVYPRGKGTALETRIFRSNLKVDRVKDILNLCKLSMDFCKNPKNQIEVENFAEFLREQADESLIGFLEHTKAFDALEENKWNA